MKYKNYKRILSFLMAIALFVSLSLSNSSLAFAEEDVATEDVIEEEVVEEAATEEDAAEEELVEEDVTEDETTESVLSEVELVEESTSVENVTTGTRENAVSYIGTISADGLAGITAPEAYTGWQATLVVNGVETKAVAGKTYTVADNAVIVYTNAAGLYGSNDSRGEEDYRTGLFVDNGAIIESKSVTEAMGSAGTYSGSSASNINMTSTSNNFNGMIFNNGTEYTISDSIFNFNTDSDGSDVSDFTAYGSVLTAFNDSKLTLDNVTINTEGVAKASIVSDNGSDIMVNDSKVNVAGGTLYDGYLNSADFRIMVAPPWVLGIGGNARGTNMLGDYSTTTIVDSEFEAGGWGVLSTDAGSNFNLTVVDTSLTLTGSGADYKEGDPKSNTKDGPTGYGVYAIGGANEYFYGTTFDVATYAVIVANGENKVTFASSDFNGAAVGNGSIDIESLDPTETEPVFTNIAGQGNNTVINSDAFGVMWHQMGDVYVEENTVMNTENAAFLIKGNTGVVNIEVDDSEINAKDKVLLQMMDNDDSAVGAGMVDGYVPVFNDKFTEIEGYPGLDNNVVTGEKADATVNAKFTNATLEGDIYNGTGYLGTAKALNVTIGENATLNGIITASSVIHSTDGGATQNTTINMDEYYKLGHVANKVYHNGDNDVAVTVAAGGTWNVTEYCEITSLTVARNGSIDLNGMTLTVNGTTVKSIKAGTTYEGEVVISDVTKVTLSGAESTAALEAGDTMILEATVAPATSSADVIWTSSDGKVATVTNGTVKAVGNGTATITAKAGGKTAVCTVTVTTSASGVTLSPKTLSLKTGGSATLTATVAPGTVSNNSVSWTSSNEKVATVSNGIVKAIGNGTAVITVETVNKKTETCTVTVTTDAASVKLSKTSLTLLKGKNEKLTAEVSPSTTSNTEVTWSSSNANIVSVSNGTITAKAKGKVTITATTANGKTATCEVTVPEVKLNKTSVTVQLKKTTTLSVSSKYPTSDSVQSWKSSKDSVATVSSSGKVTAKKAGTATITVTMKSGATATCKVTVPGVTLKSTKATLKVKGTTTIKIKSKIPSNDKVASYKSSKKSVAKVSAKGKVTAVKKGTATITVTMESGATAKFKVTVK